MIENEILNRINYFLDFKHWTIYRLAKESGIPYSSLNNIFLRNTCPSVPTLEKICAGFGIGLTEFFSFRENPLHSEELSVKEEDIVYTYRRLSTQDKALFEAYLDGLCKIERRKRGSSDSVAENPEDTSENSEPSSVQDC